MPRSPIARLVPRFVGGLLAAFAFASPSTASEGALEINQTCAVQTGCFAGDAPGFPVSITNLVPNRHFVLTSDLDTSVAADPANTDAIDLIRNGATVDLNGMVLRGPGTPGSGAGIDGGSADQVLVRDGTIRDFGGIGLRLDDDATVRDVTVQGNGGNGIQTDHGASVVGCIAVGNGGHGISAAGGAVEENVASGNDGRGFSLNSRAFVRFNSAAFNVADGFYGRFHVAFHGNVARANLGYALYADGGTVSYDRNALSEGLGSPGVVGTSGGSAAAVELGPNLCNQTFTCP